MNNNSSILFGLFDEFLWIRCSGRGSFANSPTVKSLGDDYIASGGRLIVIDLETCSGIDSTFMELWRAGRRLMPMTEPCKCLPQRTLPERAGKPGTGRPAQH
ncbi:hypothetical protein [Akkermansia sp.]|uniref:hypothetical protein n=1 Tax=Akkermansia sp. TaxID=1872421 RepID=UPI00399C8ED4